MGLLDDLDARGQDIELFLSIYEFLRDTPNSSFREIAEYLGRGLTAQRISTLIRELEGQLGGEVRLIDWDRATTTDPLEDLGSFLVEAFAQEPEARDAFVRSTGTFEVTAFHRARIYGVADDLRWGLIGALLAARSARNTLEFYKFASWRLVRCRMAVREPRFGEMLRRIG